jgi:hypothetical protein
MIELTEQDYENNFRDVVVKHRSGKEETIRVTALDHQAAGTTIQEALQKRDAWLLAFACLPEHCRAPDYLNKLSPFSTPELLAVAWGLTAGKEFLEGMLKAGAAWTKQLEARHGQ